MIWTRLQKFSTQITVTVSFHWAGLHLDVLGKATHTYIHTHTRMHARTHAHRLTAAAPPFLCNADFISCRATNSNNNDNNEDYHLHCSL